MAREAVSRGYAPSCCALADKLARLDAPQAISCVRTVCTVACAMGIFWVLALAPKPISARLCSAWRAARSSASAAPRGFIDALEGYRAAYRLLSAALDAGAWSLKRAVHDARCGMARMRQEIDGCH